jgi:hypothetical protein
MYCCVNCCGIGCFLFSYGCVVLDCGYMVIVVVNLVLVFVLEVLCFGGCYTGIFGLC